MVHEKFSPLGVRSQFSILNEEQWVYLDSAATSQKPESVLSEVNAYYRSNNANVHRGVYQLSEAATALYEGSRKKIASFLGGCLAEEIIFTRGTTESINLVAYSWCEQNLKEGDEILLTIAEHHSNIVPWQLMAKRFGAKLRYIPLTDQYRLDLDTAKEMFNNKTKIFACAHVSNVLGVIHPLKDLLSLAKEVGALTVVDGAQAVPHFSIDVLDLDCDFYTFSGHKMFAPTGIGVLYGKKSILDRMPPYQGGGDMIATVTTEGSTWNALPCKFEAGTPNISGAIGLAAAIDFMGTFDRKEALEHDVWLGRLFYEGIKNRKGMKVFYDGGNDWVGVVTFHHELIHPHDMAAIADSERVCLRAGHHCAQPLMAYLGVPATSRVSPFIYNTEQDIERALRCMDKAEKLLL
ncbi:MAG: cysteine desulfurase [Bdellovibrionota bacterium]